MDFRRAGKKLKTIRKSQGYTQASFAEKVGLSTNYYSAIENGLKIPQLDTLVEICNALRISLDDVLMDQLKIGPERHMQEVVDEYKALSVEEKQAVADLLSQCMQIVRDQQFTKN